MRMHYAWFRDKSYFHSKKCLAGMSDLRSFSCLQASPSKFYTMPPEVLPRFSHCLSQFESIWTRKTFMSSQSCIVSLKTGLVKRPREIKSAKNQKRLCFAHMYVRRSTDGQALCTWKKNWMIPSPCDLHTLLKGMVCRKGTNVMVVEDRLTRTSFSLRTDIKV